MKKLLFGLASLALSAAALSGVATVQADAASTLADNYGAYVVAAGETSGGDGWTTYYTKIGDGNGVMTFDLLADNTFGWFGLVCGDVANIGAPDFLEYALFGKDVKTTLALEDAGLGFEAGYTYKATFNTSGKKISLEKKAIGAEDEAYASVFEAAMTVEKSNVIGMAALSDGLDSSTVIIDNLSITDLSGKTTYVDNTFDGGTTVKDDSMKIGAYDAETGETNSIGNVYLHKDMLCTVRFVDESGELLATQKVCLYGSAKAPAAPKKEEYDFVGWSEDINGVRKNMLVYPLYEVHKDEPQSSASEKDEPQSSAKPDSTDENSSVGSDEGQSGILALLSGCFGIAAPMSAIGVLTAAGVAMVSKRRGK